MADSFNLDNTFYITIGDDTNYWSSPSNTEPYGEGLSSGIYEVNSIFLDSNGNTWYQLNMGPSFGTACFIPSSGAFVTDPDEMKKVEDIINSSEFRQYLVDRQTDIADKNEAAEDNASNDVDTVQNELVSANTKLIIVDNSKRLSQTSETFQYYIEKTRTTFGLPPQWSSNVDIQFPIPGTNTFIGRVYSQTIYANPTIISLTPGDIEMVTDNDTLLGMLTGENGNSLSYSGISKAVENSMNSGESFFRFVDKWEDYIKFLNEINKFIVVALGASVRQEDETYFADRRAPSAMFVDATNSSTYKDIDFKDVLGSQRLISGQPMHEHWLNFAISGQVTSEDSFSTSTRSTALESLINNNFSDTARDLYFMLGGKNIDEDAQKDINQVVSDVTNELGSGFSGIIKAAADILKGGHIDFPQVIDDCSYGKVMSVQLRFVSPYGDIESRYLNTLLPYIILFCLTAPRQLSNRYDVYMYPFIIKAACKGIFACDSGVISRLTVLRGGSQDVEWNADGHPTAIDIQLEITPLHSKLMQSKNDGLLIKNTGLQNYLSSICGVDILTSTKTLMLETAKMLLSTGRSGIFQTAFDNAMGTIDVAIQNKLSIFDAVRNFGIFTQ